MKLFGKRVLTTCAAAVMVISMSVTAFAAELQVKNDDVKVKGVTVVTPLIEGSQGGAIVDEKVNKQLMVNSFNAMLGIVSTRETPKPISSKDFPSVKQAKSDIKQLGEYLGRRLVQDRIKAKQTTPYYIKVGYDIKTGKSDKTLSVVQEVTTYTGGAHSNTTYIPNNYDLSTGKEIKLADIFAEGADYKTRLLNLMKIQAKGKQRIVNKIEEGMKNVQPEGYYCPKEITGNEKFYINAKVGELNVFYNPGEIAPISEGRKTFSFGLDTIADIIRLGK